MKASCNVSSLLNAMASVCMYFTGRSNKTWSYSLHLYPSELKADARATALSTNKSEVKRSPSPPSLHSSHMDTPDDCFYVRTQTRTWRQKKKEEIPHTHSDHL